jgi:hypothetical protein
MDVKYSRSKGVLYVPMASSLPNILRKNYTMLKAVRSFGIKRKDPDPCKK